MKLIKNIIGRNKMELPEYRSTKYDEDVSIDIEKIYKICFWNKEY